MSHPALRRLLLALSITLLPAGASLAASDLYLEIPTIPGGSTDPGHVGQVDVGSLSWGVAVAVTRSAGQPATTGKPFVQDMSWVQALDPSSLPLFGHLSRGSPLDSASFQVVDRRTRDHAPWLRLTTQRPVVSSQQFGASGGGTGLDISASMAGPVVALEYDPRALGGTGSTLTTQYTLPRNAAEGPSTRAPTTGPSTGPAGPGLYLRLGSGSTVIAGDSRAAGYENWIPITSFLMGTSVAVDASGRLAAKPSVSELSWSQRVDATAPAVLFNLLSGAAIGQATIEQVALDRRGQPMTVMQQALNDVLFSSFALSVTDGEEAHAQGSMSFSSFTQTLWPTLADGSRGAPLSFGYDAVNAKAIAAALAGPVDGFGNGNLDPTALPVPEPQTWALMLAGLAGLLGLARRRRAA